ncbi:30 kDa heat shock protein [Podospora conica]|nr:30 kDa heat shock protein [Schizothecium conicum]
MLSFFGHPYIAPAACYEPEPEPSLDALFRLFSGLDNARAPCHQQVQRHQRPQRPQVCAPRNMNVRPRLRPISTFTPRFDVRETANAYVLHGDLAGLQRENVRVEFVDPQTLVVRGRVERVFGNQPEQQQAEESTVNTTAPEATNTETTAPETAPTETTTTPEQNKPEDEVEMDWEDVKSTTSSTHSKYHRPTVEDDTDDEDSDSQVSTPKSVTSETAKPADKETTPAPETKEVQKAAAPQAPAPTPAPAPAPAKAANERVWLSERSVGEFSRAFTFAERVDQDSVTATLDNGVLSVVVPKAPKPVVRRVLIF